MSRQMNKQELASRIWQIANDLRGSMEASEYKDYILGFIFYKYLSDNEYEFLIREGYEDSDIEHISEENTDEVEWIQNNIGYFIAPENLFQTWVDLGNQFSVDNVMTALSAFQRNISSNRQHQKVFGGIFQTLESGLQNLGSTTKAQTKQVRGLVNLIKDIPTINDEYDVLGYIYEYLIGHFAAGAGKKAGEFYTPNEVSQFMSEVIADHVKDRSTIEVYDPTRGSGTLLITIGQAYELHQDSDDNVKYYAQDNIRSTEILTRMNLIMRGVKPSNIVTRNGDSLEQDPRFANYGLAPRSKADYAFLLHSLYHVKSDGIMTIVLPHGVLFRGGEEGRIRKNLVDKNNIDAIIGLPANIFYGTGIPTTVIVLKKEKDNTDILFVDASKGFEKAGNQNVLRAQDIKRMADTVIQRKEVEKYSYLASLGEIQENDYNLNIPRYVDSSEENETLLDTETRQVEIQEELTEIIETLSEEEGEYDILNAANDRFVVRETQAKLSELFEEVDMPELNALEKFNQLSNKNDRLEFMGNHPEIQWNEMDLKKDGTPSAKGLRDYEGILQQSYTFPEDSLGEKLTRALALMDEEKELKKTEKELTDQLNELTEETIQNLTDQQIEKLLFEKWIAPFRNGVRGLVDKLFKDFETQLISVHDKYSTTMADIQKEIQTSNKELIEMMNRLTGSESDMEGIRQFQLLLGDEVDE